MSTDSLKLQFLTREYHGESGVHPRQMDRFYQEKGDYDGRLFHSQSKVTYTFVDQHEVISLHFDRNRGEIFFKGHSLSNYSLDLDQIGYLDKFRYALSRDKNGQKFILEFDEILSSYKQRFFDN